MRADDAPDDVERVLDPRGPLAESFVRRVLEGARPALDGMHGRAEQLHHVDVERLTLDVDRAHVDVDRDPELRADRRGRDPVLPRARLGDDPGLPHAPREQRLADRVVDLVRAGVVEVFALEDDRRGVVPDDALRFVDRRGAADEIAQHVVILAPERGIVEGRIHLALELRERFDQHLGDERPAEAPEVAPRIRFVHRSPVPRARTRAPSGCL